MFKEVLCRNKGVTGRSLEGKSGQRIQRAFEGRGRNYSSLQALDNRWLLISGFDWPIEDIAQRTTGLSEQRNLIFEVIL